MKVCPWCGAMITKTYTNGKVPLHCGRTDCRKRHKRTRWIKAQSYRKDSAYTREDKIYTPEPSSLCALLYESGWVTWYNSDKFYTFDSTELAGV